MTYYIKGGSKYNEANPKVWVALYLGGYTESFYLDTTWKNITDKGVEANGDPYWRLGGLAGGEEMAEFGLRNQSRIKCGDEGGVESVWGWDIIGGVWVDLIAAGGGAHNRLHSMTNVLDHSANNWKIFYSDGAGHVIELPLGAVNAVLKSGGAAVAPTFSIIDHGTLNGLGDDDHAIYLLINGTRAMTGNLNMGAQAITNVGNVDGVDVSAIKLNSMPSAANGAIDANTQNIINVVDPAANQDAATKKFVDDHNWLEADIIDLDKYTQAEVDALIPTVSDIAYNEATWNANTDAATKNAIRDQIEAMLILIAANTTQAEVEAIIIAELVDGQSIDNAIDALIAAHAADSDAHHVEFTAAAARAAINDIIGADGKLDDKLDMDNHFIDDIDYLIFNEGGNMQEGFANSLAEDDTNWAASQAAINDALDLKLAASHATTQHGRRITPSFVCPQNGYTAGNNNVYWDSNALLTFGATSYTTGSKCCRLRFNLPEDYVAGSSVVLNIDWYCPNTDNPNDIDTRVRAYHGDDGEAEAFIGNFDNVFSGADNYYYNHETVTITMAGVAAGEDLGFAVYIEDDNNSVATYILAFSLDVEVSTRDESGA